MILAAHNGKALFHADKYIYTRIIYILKGIAGKMYTKNFTYIHVIGDYVEKQLHIWMYLLFPI